MPAKTAQVKTPRKSAKTVPAVKTATKTVKAVKTAKKPVARVSSYKTQVFWLVFLIAALIVTLLFSQMKTKKMSRKSDQMMPIGVTQVDQASLSDVLLGATLQVPEASRSVILSAETVSFSDGRTRGTVTLGDVFAAQKTMTGYDVLAVVSVNNGGSGTQQYLVSYVVMGEQKTQTGSYFIGDRVEVESISIVSGTQKGSSTVVVNYLDRKPEEPMAATPNVESTMTFTLYNHILSSVTEEI
jgi:hypothetical protein